MNLYKKRKENNEKKKGVEVAAGRKIDTVKKRSRKTERISDKQERRQNIKRKKRKWDNNRKKEERKLKEKKTPWQVLWSDVRVRPWCLLKAKPASLRFMAHALFPVSCGNRPTVTRLGKNTIKLPPKWGNLDSIVLIQNSGWNDLLVIVLDLTFDVFFFHVLNFYCTAFKLRTAFLSFLLFPKMLNEKEWCSLSH